MVVITSRPATDALVWPLPLRRSRFGKDRLRRLPSPPADASEAERRVRTDIWRPSVL